MFPLPEIAGPSWPIVKLPASMRTSFIPIEFVIGSAAASAAAASNKAGIREGRMTYLAQRRLKRMWFIMASEASAGVPSAKALSRCLCARMVSFSGTKASPLWRR